MPSVCADAQAFQPVLSTAGSQLCRWAAGELRGGRRAGQQLRVCESEESPRLVREQRRKAMAQAEASGAGA